jgi:transcriptional regulator with XRE-family HTH domain
MRQLWDMPDNSGFLNRDAAVLRPYSCRMPPTNRLRAHRHAQRLTQKQLAALAGTTDVTVRAIELGWRPTPRFSTQIRLANALGVRVDVLFPLPATPARGSEAAMQQHRATTT